MIDEKSKVDPDKESLKIVNRVKDDLSKFRKQIEKNVQEEQEAYWGEIWKNSNENKPYENHIFKTVETQVPIMTDSMPSPAVMPYDSAYLEQAKNLGKAIDWVNKDQNFELNYPILVRDQLITGIGYLYTYFDANADFGNGKIIDEVLKWEQVWVSGRSALIDGADKCRIELFRSKDWLKITYPKFAEKIDKLEGKEKPTSAGHGYETVDVGAKSAKRVVPKSYYDSDTLCLVKTFIRDYSLTEIPQEETEQDLQIELEALNNGQIPDLNKWEDHNAHMQVHAQLLAELYEQMGASPELGIDGLMELVEQLSVDNPEADFNAILSQIRLLETHIEEHKILAEENPEGKKPKYKNYLRVIDSVEGLVLYDGELLDEHGEIPLVPFHCHKANHFYSFGVIRNLLDSQRMQAMMMYKEYKGLQRVANPAKKVDRETGLTKDDITNEDGAIYILPQGTTIQELPPGQISPQVGQFQLERQRAIQDISGVNEATEGKIPSPTASGVTIERTQNQAIGRIRLLDRQNQYYSIKRLAKLRASMIIQYWTSEKVLKLEDANGDYNQVIFNPLEYQDLSYDIEISSGSMAGVDKDSFNGLMASFLNAGHITFTEFLQVAEIPRKEKLLELVTQRQDQQAEIQNLQRQNIELKASINPQLLSPEEMQAFEEMMREKQLEQYRQSIKTKP
jgi:hypothetical protein